jgi:hypothetical protein
VFEVKPHLSSYAQELNASLTESGPLGRCEKDTMGAYAIIGITGNVGGAAAKRLLEKGARVRAIVRTEDKAKLWQDRDAEVAIATLDDACALTAAFMGVEGVFIMTPTWFEADDMFAENDKALAALGQALRAARQERSCCSRRSAPIRARALARYSSCTPWRRRSTTCRP